MEFCLESKEREADDDERRHSSRDQDNVVGVEHARLENTHFKRSNRKDTAHHSNHHRFCSSEKCQQDEVDRE